MRAGGSHHASGISGLSAVAGIVAGGAALWLAGCASTGSVPARDRHASYPAQGAAPAATVLMKSVPEPTAFELDYAAADSVRRDGELGVRTLQPILASGQWPEPEPPSLLDTWYLWIPTTANTQLYFTPARDRWRYYRSPGY